MPKLLDLNNRGKKEIENQFEIVIWHLTMPLAELPILQERDNYLLYLYMSTTQSAVAVEYTDCISSEG